MCYLCDLVSENKEERQAVLKYIDGIITSCHELEAYYKEIRTGKISPHSSEMKKVITTEKHLVRCFLDDIL